MAIGHLPAHDPNPGPGDLTELADLTVNIPQNRGQGLSVTYVTLQYCELAHIVYAPQALHSGVMQLSETCP